MKYFGNTPWDTGTITGTNPDGELWQTTLPERVGFCRKKEKQHKIACPIYLALINAPAAYFCFDAWNDWNHYHCQTLLTRYAKMMIAGLDIKVPAPVVHRGEGV